MAAVTTAPLCACGQPSPSATLCRACSRQLAAALHLAAGLEDAAAGITAGGSGGGARPVPRSRPPADLAAMEAVRHLRLVLHGWVRVIAETYTVPLPGDSVAAMARWLAGHMKLVRRHEAAGDICREVRDAVGRVQAVIDIRPERVGAGTCELCGGQLWTEADTDAAVCDRCRAVVHGVRERRLAAAAAADMLGTPQAIAGALAKLGVTVSVGTIRMWASRGRLTVRSGGVYAMSDVMDLCARRSGLLALRPAVAHTVSIVHVLALGIPGAIRIDWGYRWQAGRRPAG